MFMFTFLQGVNQLLELTFNAFDLFWLNKKGVNLGKYKVWEDCLHVAFLVIL